MVALGCLPEPGDDQSVLTCMTDLDLTEDDTFLDGDSSTDGTDSKSLRKTMRSEVI